MTITSSLHLADARCSRWPPAPLSCPSPAASTAQSQKPIPKDWIQLFNGKNLDGWTPKFAKHDLGENYNNTFRVEDGLLKVRYDKWETFNGEFGHMFYKDPFCYYVHRAPNTGSSASR